MPQIKDDKEWDSLHIALKETLQKEISIMRELLSNMHQEEVFLLVNDQGSLNELLEQRSIIIEKLGFLRSYRLETTQKIEKIVSKEKKPTPESMLPLEEEISTEILSLRDQLMALTEHMNRQQAQNQYLTKHPEYARSASLQAVPKPKRKASIATYQIKK